MAVLIGLALIATLSSLDAYLGPNRLLAATVLIAPLVVGLAASPRQTAVVAFFAAADCAASALWNQNFGAPEYFVSLAVVCLGGAFAIVGAQARVRLAGGQDRFDILMAAAEVADGTLPLDQSVARLGDLIVPSFADISIIDVLRDERVERLGVRASGPGAREIEDGLRRRAAAPSEATPSEALTAINTGRARLLEHVDDSFNRDAARDEAELAFLRSMHARSSIVVPLRSRGRVMGAMTAIVTRDSGRSYESGDLDFAKVLAGRVGLALDNAGLFSELETLEAQLTAALGSLAEAVTVQDAEGKLVYANDAAAEALGFESADALMSTPTQDVVDAFDIYNEDGSPVLMDQLPGRNVLAGRRAEPLIVRAVHRETGEERWRMTKATPVLEADGRPRLAVNIIEDVTEVKRAELTQRLLAQAGEMLGSSLDYEPALAQVARLAVPELADWCGVSMPDERGVIRQVAVAHVDPAKVRFAHEYNTRYPARMTDPAGVAAVLRDGESQLVQEIPDDLLEQAIEDPEQLELLRSIGMRAVLIVPMVAAGEAIGALTFVTAESGRSFTPADVALAEELGRRAGTSVANARLYTERSRIARTLQSSLLPQALPDIPGFMTASLYRPAGEENWVGGDFYDAFRTERGWMIAIGDVAGRGAEAAALTGLARYTLRTSGQLLGDPLAALAQLNRELLARSETSLCTVALVALDYEDQRRATVVCAGHPLPLLIRAGSSGGVGRWGAMLGAWEDSTWEPVTVELGPSDVLVLYTDGVLDARGEQGRFGEERLLRTLVSVADADEAISQIEQALNDFEVGEQADDTAAVALMRSQADRAPREAVAPAARPEISLQLPGGPGAPARGRRAVVEHFGEELDTARLYDLQVIVSELVTNAVRHGGAHDGEHVGIVLSSGERALRVEVSDPGAGFERPEHPAARDDGGNGLILVARLSDRWGVQPGPPTVVWAELDHGR